MNLNRMPILILVVLTVLASGCSGLPLNKPPVITPCPRTPNCVSSITNGTTEGIKPFTHEGYTTEVAWEAMLRALKMERRVRVIKDTDSYLHAECRTFLGFVDDVEFMVAPQSLIHVKSASRLGKSDLGVNGRRVSRIRHRFEEILKEHTKNSLDLKNTVYYLALESDYSRTDKNGLFLDPKGDVLYAGSAEFKSKASIEGSARLADGRTLSYHSRVNDEVRWAEADALYGSGVACPLIPMRTIAADPEVLPQRSIVYIKKTAGIKLPDGTVHDGRWYVLDTGSAIKEDRIDLFAGAGMDSMKLITAHGIKHMAPLTVTITGSIKNCPDF